MIDVNKPLENPKLKNLLKKMYENDNLELQNEILEEIIMNAHFLSYVNFSEPLKVKENGESVFEKDSKINFNMLSTNDNKVYFPAFTDWEELGKWGTPEKMETLILNFDDYVRMVLENEETEGLVINPFGNSYIFSREWLKELKAMKEERLQIKKVKFEKNTKVLLSEPEVYPTEMLEAIKDCCKNLKSIKNIWLLLMLREKEKSWLLVVDFDGNKDEIFSKIAEVSRNHLENDMYLDMISYDDEFSKNAVKNRKPFYTK